MRAWQAFEPLSTIGLITCTSSKWERIGRSSTSFGNVRPRRGLGSQTSQDRQNRLGHAATVSAFLAEGVARLVADRRGSPRTRTSRAEVRRLLSPSPAGIYSVFETRQFAPRRPTRAHADILH